MKGRKEHLETDLAQHLDVDGEFFDFHLNINMTAITTGELTDVLRST